VRPECLMTSGRDRSVEPSGLQAERMKVEAVPFARQPTSGPRKPSQISVSQTPLSWYLRDPALRPCPFGVDRLSRGWLASVLLPESFTLSGLPLRRSRRTLSAGRCNNAGVFCPSQPKKKEKAVLMRFVAGKQPFCDMTQGGAKPPGAAVWKMCAPMHHIRLRPGYRIPLLFDIAGPSRTSA